MPQQPIRLIIVWCVGLVVGTAVIGVTSPLFVRSYLAEHFDSARGRYVPVPGDYRWRSEGYAVTSIGPHGMPGREDLAPKTAGSIRAALWGDSQAEGVCVADSQKLFARIQDMAKQSGHSIEVLPLASSGEDASHWLTQLPTIERALDIDLHVLMIVDLPDVLAAELAPVQYLNDRQKIESKSAIAARVPAFAIQALRCVMTEPDGSPRRLRFSLGPSNKPTVAHDAKAQVGRANWENAIGRIRRSTKLPILIAYVPNCPSIAFGKIQLHNPWDEQFQEMERTALAAGIHVVDTTDALGQAVRQGRWPHGFHNGRIGSGHLNAVGYDAVARQLAPAIAELSQGGQ